MKLLTVQEACTELRISRATLFRMARAGTVRFTKLGPRTNRVQQSEVERLVQKGTR